MTRLTSHLEPSTSHLLPYSVRSWFYSVRTRSSVPSRDYPRPLHHQNDRPLRRASAVDDALRNYESLALAKLHGAPLQIDQKLSLDDVEKLVEVVVLVPVILSLHHTEPHDRVVDLAKRLIVPLVFHGIDDRGNVDDLERRIADIQVGGVGEILRHDSRMWRPTARMEAQARRNPDVAVDRRGPGRQK